MFEGMYSHIQKKPFRRSHLLQEAMSLAALLDTPDDDIKRAHFIAALINELRALLKIENSYDLIEELFSTERRFELVKEKFPDVITDNLDGFYRDLSPVLLQKFWERKKNPLQEETVDRLFLESIHIAVEEEIYIWQGKSK